MTPPREQHPGVTYHVTRTTIGRKFLLRPDDVVTQVMLFCLFRAAEIYGCPESCPWVLFLGNLDAGPPTTGHDTTT